MFLIWMATLIISLMWSVQLFVTIHGVSTVVWLNVSMMVAWITLCFVFCRKYVCVHKRPSPLLELLIEV